MNPGSDIPVHPRARDIFLEALDQPDAPARARFVAAACADDPGLRQEVERLLEDHFASDGFMAAPARGEPAAPPPAEAPGSVIGRYKLLEPIGEGGMGVVFMAEQREPVARRVALKVIKLGLDTRAVIARFEAERQALALMDHPHIAKVLDGGATASGRPYFVMELVQGIPLTEFCARNHLSVAERLRLFLPVCHAVQHAHQKGVIHRDLKPSNILVTQSHGAPHPLIIDFGVAKATQQRLTEKTIFTNFGTLLGTPAYMSPEQAEPGREDVDTRSDLYSLGVLLYELLTGTQPFPEQRLRSVAYAEMQRIIQHEEPERPSTRLSRTAEAAPGVARRLRSEPGGVVPTGLGGTGDSPLGRPIQARPADIPASSPPRSTPSGQGPAGAGQWPVPPRRLRSREWIAQLRGDLDWIVLKCLEKDRRRRYETVNGLAADLQRHLAHEPVTARPPSTAYRLQKAVRRHRLAVAAGVGVVLALVAGIAATTWQAIRATRAEREQAALLKTAQETERARTEELWRSLLTTSRASRQSGTAGRRFASLQAIRQATAIRPSLELRNEAIAALALTDLGPPQFGRDTPWTGEQPREADAAFDRDVLRVALNAQDGSIYIHRVEDHAELLHIPASVDFAQGEAVRMVFSPDDRCLAARAENGAVRCWRLEPFRLVVDARLDAEFWNSLTFSSDSRFLVAGRADGRLVGFPLDQGRSSSTEPIRGPAWEENLDFKPWAVTFNAANTRFAVLREDQAQVWRWPERRRTQNLQLAGWGESLTWHPDGQHLWTVGEGGTAQLWNIGTPWSRTLKGPFEHLAQAFMHPRGDFIATYSYFGVTRLWGITDEGPRLATPDGLARTFSRDGSRLGFFHMSNRYGYWPVALSRVYRSLAGASGRRSFGNLDFSPDGSVLVWCDSDGFWSLDLRRGGYRRYPSAGLTRAHFNESGDSLFAGDGTGLRIQPIELDRSEGDVAVRWRGVATAISGGAFPIYGNNISVPLNRRQLAASQALTSRLVWVNDQGIDKSLNSSCAPAIGSASVSPDERWLAMGHWLGGTCVLDLRTEQVVRSWPELNTAHVSFTPDAEWLVIGTAEEYRFWRAGTWEPGRRLMRGVQSSMFSPLAFSSDGRTLARLKGLGTVELHDLNTGETLATLESPTPQAVHCLNFSPQGNLLAVIGIAAVQVWDLAELRRELKALGLDWHHPPIPDSGISLGDLTFRYVTDPN